MKKKINVGMIMFIEVVSLCVGLMLIMGLSGDSGFKSVLYFLDLPSLLMVLIFALPGVFACGMWKDFGRLFSINNQSKQYSMSELKKSLLAVRMLQKQTIFAGLLTVSAGLIMMLARLDTPETIGANLAVALIALFYVAIIEMLLVPLRVAAEKRIAEYMEENN